MWLGGKAGAVRLNRSGEIPCSTGVIGLRWASKSCGSFLSTQTFKLPIVKSSCARRQAIDPEFFRSVHHHFFSYFKPETMSGKTLTAISPSTNEPIVTRKAASAEEIAKLPSIAQKAFTAYRKSYPTLSSRQKIVTKALQLLNEKQDELAKELTEQMGRPIAYTAKEITTAVKRGEYLNSIAGEILGQDVPGKEEAGFRRFIRREPVGVVLVLFAWNVRPGHC
jgi:delta 1-pyrroline-5-carboxylate dehydrogenase